VAWSLGALLFLIGTLIGWLVSKLPHPTLRDTVDAGGVLGVITTLTVATFLHHIYNRSFSRSRAQTDMLVEYARDVKSALDQVYESFLPCESGKKIPKEIAARIRLEERALSNSLHSLESALTHCELKDVPKKLFVLKDSRINLKEALTNSPFPDVPFDAGRVSTILGAFKAFRDELTRVTFDLNRRWS
jgi:hypothetical protein